MKRKIISVLMVLLFVPFLVMAQKSPTDEMFRSYSGLDGFTTVHISKELFNMMSQMDTEDDPDAEEIKDVMENLDFIRVLMCEKATVGENKFDDFVDELNNFELVGFKELMIVKEEDEVVRFMIRKKGEQVEEMLLLIQDDSEAGFVSIFGMLDMETISNLSKSMNLKGLEELEKLEEEEK